MKLQNKSKRSYVHSYFDKINKLVILKLQPGEIKEIPDEVAKKWLCSNEVIQYVAPQEAKALKAENDKLKKQLEQLKKENKKENKKNNKKQKEEKTEA